jgi:hypothetical protein
MRVLAWSTLWSWTTGPEYCSRSLGTNDRMCGVGPTHCCAVACAPTRRGTGGSPLGHCAPCCALGTRRVSCLVDSGTGEVPPVQPSAGRTDLSRCNEGQGGVCGSGCVRAVAFYRIFSKSLLTRIRVSTFVVSRRSRLTFRLVLTAGVRSRNTEAQRSAEPNTRLHASLAPCIRSPGPSSRCGIRANTRSQASNSARVLRCDPFRSFQSPRWSQAPGPGCLRRLLPPSPGVHAPAAQLTHTRRCPSRRQRRPLRSPPAPRHLAPSHRPPARPPSA